MGASLSVPTIPVLVFAAMEIELTGDAAEDAALFPRTARLFDYWRSLAPPPCWGGVDLMVLYDIAPQIFVADVGTAGDALTFTYRYVGTRIVTAFGFDATGMTVEQAFEGEYMEQIRDAYLYVVSEKSPQFGVRQQANENREYVRMAVLTVPLFGAGGRVEKIMGLADFSVMEEKSPRHLFSR